MESRFLHWRAKQSPPRSIVAILSKWSLVSYGFFVGGILSYTQSQSSLNGVSFPTTSSLRCGMTPTVAILSKWSLVSYNPKRLHRILTECVAILSKWSLVSYSNLVKAFAIFWASQSSLNGVSFPTPRRFGEGRHLSWSQSSLNGVSFPTAPPFFIVIFQTLTKPLRQIFCDSTWNENCMEFSKSILMKFS